MTDTSAELPTTFETLGVRRVGGVLLAEISAPPMNLLGPALVRDLVALIRRAESDAGVRVLVFTSGDPDYFISHVDLNQVAEYRAEAAKLTGEPSIALLFRYLSASRLITIAQIEGRVRGAGSEFALACDMRFAARETAIFAQFEAAFGQLPGGGAAQHLTRLMGRARALEIMLSAEDYDADLAERYGWVNRAMPAAGLAQFVGSLAERIAAFPDTGQLIVKDRVNAIGLAPAEDFRRDSDLFGSQVGTPEAQRRIAAALAHGFQTRDVELKLGEALGDWAKEPSDDQDRNHGKDTMTATSAPVDGHAVSPSRMISAANGIDYAYRDTGEGRGSPPLVLLQHFRGNLDNWDPALIDALGSERRVITFDNTGVGGSGGATPSTITQMAVDAIAFIEAMQLPLVDVLGFSIGSFVAQEIALIRPELVRRLVLASSAPRGAAGMHGWATDVIEAVGAPAPNPDGYLGVFFAASASSRTAGTELLGRITSRTQDRDAPTTWATRQAQYDAVCGWGIPNHSLLQRVGAIEMPVFVANGDSDPMILPHYSHLLAGLIPHAQVKIYPDSAHGFLFQHHVEFARDVAGFLDAS